MNPQEHDKRAARRLRPPPGSRPSLKAFVPYMVLGVVLALVSAWFVLGPMGTDRGQPVAQVQEQEQAQDAARAPAEEEEDSEPPSG